MKKTMKRFPIIIALLLASCTPGKIDPRAIIEAELMKVLNDPESYEFVSLEKLDSSSYAMQINKDRELYEYFSNDNLDDDSPFEIYYRSALDTLNTIVGGMSADSLDAVRSYTYLITYRANNGVGAKILDQTFVQMSPSGEVFEMTDDMEELVRHPEGTPPGFERIEAMEKASGLFSR
ncbi:MAG: hypothetical protein WBK97_01130 [Bacteroidales bacterium]